MNEDKSEIREPADVKPAGIRDTRMMERAMRERWPMTPAIRRRMVQEMIRIVVGLDEKGQRKEYSQREKFTAFRLCLHADTINMEALKEVLPEQHVHLHQGVNFDNIPVDELKRIEAELLKLAYEGQGLTEKGEEE